jgi:sugar O-acyltransferase (sialic acid O-acetyltransferase NeuD family)
LKKIIIVGSGGHARVLAQGLAGLDVELAGFLDPARSDDSGVQNYLKIPIFKSFSEIKNGSDFHFLLGLGSVADPSQRIKRYEELKKQCCSFFRFIHKDAFVESSVAMTESVQVHQAAVIQNQVQLGENVIVNTSSVIDHDCVLGDHVHIATGARLCGGVNIGDRTHIGAGSTVIQSVRIVSDVIVGAGSVVTKDLLEPGTYFGAPARRK